MKKSVLIRLWIDLLFCVFVNFILIVLFGAVIFI